MTKVALALVIGFIAGQSLTVADGEPVALQANMFGRLYAQCVDQAKTEAELLAWLRTLPADTVGLIGYVGNDGDAYALTEAMLKGQP